MATTGRKRTPMMDQYLSVRRELPPNCILLFRLGDFYEMFDEDAREGAPILGIALTQRNGQPMAGLPYHAADSYIQKLLAAGKKVAICEQVETPRPGQLVKRSLTRILTAGTTLEDHQQDSRRPQYLLALDFRGKKGGVVAAWLDLSTGDFAVAHEPAADNLLSALTSLDPREIIVPEGAPQLWRDAGVDEATLRSLDPLLSSRPISELPGFHFDVLEGSRAVMDILGVINLEGFGLPKDHSGLGPAGALLAYATETLRERPENLFRIRSYRAKETLLLDPATQRNLEIFRSSANTREGSLLAAMDRCVTSPGSRLLESYLAAPVLDLRVIQRRQRCIGELLEAPAVAGEIQDYLRCVRDIPRVLSRLRNRLRNPREIGAIRDTLQQLPSLKAALSAYEGPELTALSHGIREFGELSALLERGLAEELPHQLQEGGYIADGYDEELDHLRSLTRDSKAWISKLEADEAARTGIRKLKIRFNNTFGYFIEVTKPNLHLVPEDYIRRQTTVNSERFYTAALKEKEKEILHADERSIVREERLFREIVEKVLEEGEALEKTAEALAELDLFIGWSVLAREWDYCQPELDESGDLQIKGGRHPVVEQTMRTSRQKGVPGDHDFVPNDTELRASSEQIAVITGPNMAGKSTYIRQVALITLMAHVGAWVPAKRCRIGLVDRVFSRVGASDELARGNSTFMVEMNETANILNNFTDRSLIILDEIGRGTSTYDGLSIAWAVVEHLHGSGPAGPRTLFATHYHEITQIDQKLDRVRNFCVAVKEWNDRIVFVRQVVPGAADRSYGIQVARLAGLPQSVITRAKTILAKLEGDDSSHNLLRLNLKDRKSREARGEDPGQLEMF